MNEENTKNNTSGLSLSDKNSVNQEPVDEVFFFASQREMSGYEKKTEFFEPMVLSDKKQIRLNPVLVLVSLLVLIMGVIVSIDMLKKEPGTLEGAYKFTYAEASGKTMTQSQLRARGLNSANLCLEIGGDKAKVSLDENLADCDYTVDGDEIIITKGEKVLKGEVDLIEETVTLEMDGADLIFEKM